MSEFGKGFTYNLFLFAKHWWKVHEDLEKWKEMRAYLLKVNPKLRIYYATKYLEYLKSKF